MVQARELAALVAATCLAACSHWVPLEPPLGPALEAEGQADRLRVTAAGEQVVLESPKLERDTLIGTSTWTATRSSVFRDPVGPDTLRIPLHALNEVEARRTDVGATVGVALLGVVAAGAIALAILVASGTELQVY